MAQKSKERKRYCNIGKNDNSTIKICGVSITFVLAYVWNKWGWKLKIRLAKEKMQKISQYAK